MLITHILTVYHNFNTYYTHLHSFSHEINKRLQKRNKWINSVSFTIFYTNILQEKIIKQADKAETVRIWNYPLETIKEAIINTIYHCDYPVWEPIEIRIYPDSIVIVNYGGSYCSIKSDSFKVSTIKPRLYRNRRLGDFLKELDLTEGKATGILCMKKVFKITVVR